MIFWNWKYLVYCELRWLTFALFHCGLATARPLAYSVYIILWYVCFFFQASTYIFFQASTYMLTNVVLFCYLVLHSEKTSTYNVVNYV